MIGPVLSKYNNRFCRVNKTNVKCVYVILQNDQVKARKSKNAYQNDLRARVTQLVRSAKSRSKTRSGVASDLDENDIYIRVAAGKCEATGVLLDLEYGNRSIFTPSLDQIVPSAGYTNDNVQVVCWIYNTMKSVHSTEEVNAFIAALKEAG